MQTTGIISRALAKQISAWWKGMPALAKLLFGGYALQISCHLVFAVWLYNQLQQGIPADELLEQSSFGSALLSAIEWAVISEMGILVILTILGTTVSRKFHRIRRETMSYYSFSVLMPMIMGSACFFGLYALIVAAHSTSS